MTAKEYLQQIKKDNIRINQLIAEISKLKSDTIFLSGIDYSKDRIQSSHDGGLTAAIEKYCDMERKLDKMIDEYVDRKNKIISEIHGMNKSEHIELLYLRYVSDKKFEEIACEMNYSYNRAIHLHGEALASFDKKYHISRS